MRISLLATLSLALLASPALGQQQATVGASVRIVETLRVSAAAMVVSEVPSEPGSARLTLPVQRGWSWSVAARSNGAAVPLAVRVCRAERCVGARAGGLAESAPGTLVVDYPAAGAEPSSGTLTYLVAPL